MIEAVWILGILAGLSLWGIIGGVFVFYLMGWMCSEKHTIWEDMPAEFSDVVIFIACVISGPLVWYLIFMDKIERMKAGKSGR